MLSLLTQDGLYQCKNISFCRHVIYFSIAEIATGPLTIMPNQNMLNIIEDLITFVYKRTLFPNIYVYI